MSDGDLSQVTQAIQNALRPQPVTTRLIHAPNGKTSGIVDEDQEADFTEVVQDDLDVAPPSRQKPTRNSKPRVAKTPNVLDDIDVTSDPSLKDFVSGFEISTAVDKYLVIALWFRDARATPAITVDHIYTCFKMLGWSTNSNDFAKPMRNLRDEQSFKGGAKEGYSLTLPGAGKIEGKKRAQ